MPDKARSGALMPRFLAPLAGINYETMKQLCNGGLEFDSSSTFHQLIAENLSFTTGVHPNFRTSKEAFIRDIRGREYTAETYLWWIDSSKLKEWIAGRKQLSKKVTGYTQALASSITTAAEKKGLQYTLMAARLINEALTRVSRDLGVLEDIQQSPDLKRAVLFWSGNANSGALPTFLEELPWRPDMPLLSMIVKADD